MEFVVLTALAAFLLLSWKLKTVRVVHLKRLVLPLFCIVFIACLALFSKTAVNSASKGLNLWLNVVFPSLFPFFAASDILNATGALRIAGILLEPVMRPVFNIPGCGAFAFAMGITSGYPVGAKITSGLRKENFLTREEAERLLAFSNNSGPLFIIGAMSTGMFKMPQLGLFMFLCHIAACVSVGVILGLWSKYPRSRQRRIFPDSWKISTNHSHAQHTDRCRYNVVGKIKAEFSSARQEASKSLGTILGDAVKNSVMTLLAIGGFIILFSVIVGFLLETGIIGTLSEILAVILSPLGINKELASAVLCGFLEITTGTYMASSAPGTALSARLAAASLITGWAGISVHSQVLSIVSATDISMKKYLCGKFLHGILASFYTYGSLKMAGTCIAATETAHYPFFRHESLNWLYYFLASWKLAAISLLLIAAAAAIGILQLLQRKRKRNRLL